MKQLKVIGSVILGNAMLAFAVCAFIVPNGFMMGGSTGIALVLQQYFPIRLSVWSAILNTVLFFLGLAFLGWKFASKTLLSTIIYPMLIGIFETMPLGEMLHEDALTSVLFFSVIAGAGIGIVIRVGGATGGMDIPPCILQRYKGIPVGDSMMVFDGAVLLMQVLVKGSVDGMLHGILIVYLLSTMVNRTVVAGVSKIAVTIISPCYREIRAAVLSELDCGVTMLNVENGYTCEQQQAVYSVVYAKKYPEIRDAALKIDPHAFIVASDVKNVNGRGYTLDRNPLDKNAI